MSGDEMREMKSECTITHPQQTVVFNCLRARLRFVNVLFFRQQFFENIYFHLCIIPIVIRYDMILTIYYKKWTTCNLFTQLYYCIPHFTKEHCVYTLTYEHIAQRTNVRKDRSTHSKYLHFNDMLTTPTYIRINVAQLYAPSIIILLITYLHISVNKFFGTFSYALCVCVCVLSIENVLLSCMDSAMFHDGGIRLWKKFYIIALDMRI